MSYEISYFCDGKCPECMNEAGCYVNGGPCDRTFDINHAKYFVKTSLDQDITLFYQVTEKEKEKIHHD